MIDLTGRGAVVTGAAGGLGKAICASLAAGGAKVWMWDQSAEGLAEAAGEIGRSERVCTAVVDLSSSESIAEAAAKAMAEDQIDILVNNGAISTTYPGLKEPIENFTRVIDINLTGTLRCCQALMPEMVKRGYGRVINISSAAYRMAFPHHASYNSSKAGVVALTKTLGKEYGSRGVAMNCIIPGYFDTAMYQAGRSNMDSDPYTPIKRIGRPEELAELVLWLASPLCSYSIGAVFDCSGGIAV